MDRAEVVDYEGLVRMFMVKHDLTREAHTPEVALTRIRLMIEELSETIIAIHERDYKLIADGLADLLYTVFGTAITFNICVSQAFLEVHRSNMTKPSLNEFGKGGKGVGFQPPQFNKSIYKSKED